MVFNSDFEFIEANGGIKLACFFHKISCLSNHYTQPKLIQYKGQFFNCTEQLFMVTKAKTFGDKEAVRKIFNTSNPQVMKIFGRQVKNYDHKLWDSKRLEVMLHVNRLKFTQNPHLLERLLKTENSLLVEVSKYDMYWGAGIHVKDPRIQNPADWPGANHFGVILTKIRDELKIK